MRKKEFETLLTSLSKVCTTEEQARSIEQTLFNKLDKPLSRAIDLAVGGGGKFNKSTFITALKSGEYKEGTAPAAAFFGAISFMKDAIRKLK